MHTYKKEKKEEEKNERITKTVPIKGKKQLKIEKNEVKSFEIKENDYPSLIKNVKRPNFTEDEILEMKNDFNNLDINNEGKIKPSLILLFAEKNENFKKKTPIYYEALKDLNNKENNLNGISFEQFIDSVKNVIQENYTKNYNNWGENYLNNFKDKDSLFNAIKDLGFDISDEEIQNLISKIGKDFDQKKFISIMKEVEGK